MNNMNERPMLINMDEVDKRATFIEVYADASLRSNGKRDSKLGYIVSSRERRGQTHPFLWKLSAARRISKSTNEAEVLSVMEV